MSVSSALRKLRLRRLTLQDIETFYRQIDNEPSDRGAALLAATLVDATLEYAIHKRLPKSGDIFQQLFDNGPLGTFDAKILIAYSLDIIGRQTRHNLDTIKHIRNTLAHSNLDLNFSTKEIQDACNMLILQDQPESFREIVDFNGPYAKYISICEVTSYALVRYVAGIYPVKASLMMDAWISVPPQSLP